MTVKTCLEDKYKAFMLKVNCITWRNIKEKAEFKKCNPAEIVFADYLSITEEDIKKHGGWGSEFHLEIKRMHEQKLLASNIHRQYHGRVVAYWLTKKGLKQLGI